MGELNNHRSEVNEYLETAGIEDDLRTTNDKSKLAAVAITDSGALPETTATVDIIKLIRDDIIKQNETLVAEVKRAIGDVKAELMKEIRKCFVKLNSLEKEIIRRKTGLQPEHSRNSVRISDDKKKDELYDDTKVRDAARCHSAELRNQENALKAILLDGKADEGISDVNNERAESPQLLHLNVSSRENTEERSASTSYQSEIVPKVSDYQLIGDSMLARYARDVLQLPYDVGKYGTKKIGYCTSGDTLLYLRKRIEQNEYRLHDKIIMMIGTNNLKKNHQPNQMINDLNRLVTLLLDDKGVRKLILLTVPPILLKERQVGHWFTLQEYNRAILALDNGRDIRTIDFAKYFIDYRENEKPGSSYVSIGNSSTAVQHRVKAHLYESLIGNKVDKVHINYEAFLILKKLFNKHLRTN